MQTTTTYNKHDTGCAKERRSLSIPSETVDLINAYRDSIEEEVGYRPSFSAASAALHKTHPRLIKLKGEVNKNA